MSKPSAQNPQESVLSLVIRAFFWSVLIALLLVAWTPNSLPSFSLGGLFGEKGKQRAVVLLPTPTPPPSQVVGIISGHWKSDSGAVCPNGMAERDINHRIALLVQEYLRQQGYKVDLLAEFDPRLNGYRAAALVSIHADTCKYLGKEYTGFKIAPARGLKDPAQLENSIRLKNCIASRYAAETGLRYHPNSYSRDMTEYHVFNTIDPHTPAVIIETGFMNMDYDILVNHPAVVAKGIADGILCYLRNEPLRRATATPKPTATKAP